MSEVYRCLLFTIYSIDNSLRVRHYEIMNRVSMVIEYERFKPKELEPEDYHAPSRSNNVQRDDEPNLKVLYPQ